MTCAGHALSLTLLSKYLVKDFDGDIKKTGEIPPFYSDKETGGKAHRILLWYENQLTNAERVFVQMFSLFNREGLKTDFDKVFYLKMETSINQVLLDMKGFSLNRIKDNLGDRRLIYKRYGYTQNKCNT